MMLKKQTVWLLTMLSLVVVLSVYYITSPDGSKNEAAVTEGKQGVQKEAAGAKENGQTAKEKDKNSSSTETAKDGSTVSTVQDDDLFTSIRMEMEDARNERKEELSSIVASNNATTEEKNNAYDQMKEMSDTANKEALLETLIKSKNYDDALVRIENGKVNITVKAKKQSAQAANDILMLVKNEIDNMDNVAVTFEPAK
ncbi:SpoIIIAH-like family protein [Metabacillus sp. RGM 3146]|uniref:SpoIIIAH-like family protein n=1 Tax=Metabacillus sp. RGM 3146 TaxID=3401092 RepID=UPI003B9B01BE